MRPTVTLLTIIIFISSCEKKTTAPTATNNRTIATDTTQKYSGEIFTCIGNGNDTGSYSGDGGPALKAGISGPGQIKMDASGNIYIADQENHRIRKVNANGIITTVAGNGTKGYSGDGGPAGAAEVADPYGIAIDAAGNVYFSDADAMCNCIRKINTSGIISTVAGIGGIPGGGFSGDGGPAAAAQLNTPMGLAVDRSGSLYIADYANLRVRKINVNGIITTVAGNGKQVFYTDSCGDGGPATTAEVGATAVALDDSGNLYIADSYDNCVRKVNSTDIISAFVGIPGNNYANNGYSGDGGLATVAQLSNPHDVTVDEIGNVFIADANNNVIRMVNKSGIISTYAGNGNAQYSGDGGPALKAGVGYSEGITVDTKGNLYISELYYNRIRVVAK